MQKVHQATSTVKFLSIETVLKRTI